MEWDECWAAHQDLVGGFFMIQAWQLRLLDFDQSEDEIENGEDEDLEGEYLILNWFIMGIKVYEE